MKKNLLVIIPFLVILVSCSTTGTFHSGVTSFDSYGYDVEKEDIYALAEVLYATDEVGKVYGSCRLSDAIGIDTKTMEEKNHYIEYGKQWTKLIIGLNVFFDYSDNPDRYYFFLENQAPGSYSTIPFGARGPAGGYVFYDKGSYSNGWRFLEAAPKDLKGYAWDERDYDLWREYGTSTDIGTGKKNTEMISGRTIREYNAANACLDYSLNGYDDWFLPSKGELNLMYVNLRKKSMGGFANRYYWSSSEFKHTWYAWKQDFNDGDQDYYDRYNGSRVRPVRAF